MNEIGQTLFTVATIYVNCEGCFEHVMSHVDSAFAVPRFPPRFLSRFCEMSCSGKQLSRCDPSFCEYFLNDFSAGS